MTDWKSELANRYAALNPDEIGPRKEGLVTPWRDGASRRLSREYNINNENPSTEMPETWVELIRLSRIEKCPAPIFASGSRSLGDKVLDHALDKAISAWSKALGLAYADVRKWLVESLRVNRVARRSGESTIRFLRNISLDFFTECPECGTDNDPSWTQCTECKYINDR